VYAYDYDIFMEIEREDGDINYINMTISFFSPSLLFLLPNYIHIHLHFDVSFQLLSFFSFLSFPRMVLLATTCICMYDMQIPMYIRTSYCILGIHRNATVSVKIRVYSSFQIHIKYPSQVKAVPSFTGYISLFFFPFLLLPLSSLKGFHK
jgi:hypothetical protein